MARRCCVLRAGLMTALVVASLLAASSAAAVSIGLFNITGNNATNAAIGQAQLFVEATDAGAGQVLFSFYNLGPEASSITDVYFADGTLLAIAAINDSDPGVDFDQGASPWNLPGGKSVGFVATQAFASSSISPTQPNGINPGESLGILFELQGSQDFGDVVVDLGSGALQIGLHVQGFDDGGSESFVNTPIPEPGTMVGLCTFGIVASAARSVKRRTATRA